MRWYCLVILFAVASLSARAYPADGDLEEAKDNDVLAVDNGEDAKEDISRILMESEEEDEDDEDDDEEEGVNGDNDEVSVADDPLSVADRHLRKPSKKPMKGKDDSSSEEDKKGGKKAPKKKCVCYMKKHNRHQKRRPSPHKSGRSDSEQTS
jgi:hypothetical protein